MKHWADGYNWGCTNFNHVWQCVETTKYHWSDETGNLDCIGYDDICDCYDHMKVYFDSM